MAAASYEYLAVVCCHLAIQWSCMTARVLDVDSTAK
jgi:hypothetical protein